MVMYLTEKEAKKVFKKYKRVAVFSTDRSMKAVELRDGTIIPYTYLEDLYPNTEEINAYVRGDIGWKKLLSNYKKKLQSWNYKNPEAVQLQLTLTAMINMIKDNSGQIVIFLRPQVKREDPETGKKTTDKEAKKLDKMFKKYLTWMFSRFGLDLQTKIEKKWLKGSRSKVKEKLGRIADIKGKVSSYGRFLNDYMNAMHYAEVQQHTTENIADPSDLTKRTHTILANRFIGLVTGNQAKAAIKNIKWKENCDKKSIKKIQKATLRNAKDSIEYYNDYCEMINPIIETIVKDKNPDLTEKKLAKQLKKVEMIKVPKFGKKMKKKTIVKLDKWLQRRKNVAFIAGAYAHIVAQTYNYEIGTPEYNKVMADAHRMLNAQFDGFAKTFASMATKMRKAQATAAAK